MEVAPPLKLLTVLTLLTLFTPLRLEGWSNLFGDAMMFSISDVTLMFFGDTVLSLLTEEIIWPFPSLMMFLAAREALYLPLDHGFS